MDKNNKEEAEDNKELPMKKRELIQPITQFEFNTLTTKYKHTLKNYQRLYVYTTDSKTTVTEYEVMYNRLSRDPVIVDKGTFKIEGAIEYKKEIEVPGMKTNIKFSKEDIENCKNLFS